MRTRNLPKFFEIPRYSSHSTEPSNIFSKHQNVWYCFWYCSSQMRTRNLPKFFEIPRYSSHSTEPSNVFSKHQNVWYCFWYCSSQMRTSNPSKFFEIPRYSLDYNSLMFEFFVWYCSSLMRTRCCRPWGILSDQSKRPPQPRPASRGVGCRCLFWPPTWCPSVTASGRQYWASPGSSGFGPPRTYSVRPGPASHGVGVQMPILASYLLSICHSFRDTILGEPKLLRVRSPAYILGKTLGPILDTAGGGARGRFSRRDF